MTNASKVNGLIDELKHGSKFARGNAAYMLGKMGEQAVPALIEALNSENIEVRRYSAYALG
jgi:HEAT repeat protein